MIHLQHLSVLYPNGKLALDRVTTTIHTGEMVIVTGPTGSGKSTLLKAISLIEPPTSGVLTINGKDMMNLKRKRIPYYRRTLGLVFQDQKLLMDRTVLDNLVFPLEVIGFSRKEALSRAQAALERVELEHAKEVYPNDLSGGEQKALCIARAIINKPAIVLADEPFLNLDTAVAKKIFTMFKTISQVGITVVIASHQNALIRNPQERMLRLDTGVLVE